MVRRILSNRGARLLCALLLIVIGACSPAGDGPSLGDDGGTGDPKGLPVVDMGDASQSLDGYYPSEKTVQERVRKKAGPVAPKPGIVRIRENVVLEQPAPAAISAVPEPVAPTTVAAPVKTTVRISGEVLYEEPYPEIDPWMLHDTPASEPLPEPPKPKVAIIIDDMGYNRAFGEQLLALDYALTFSYLPYGPYTQDQEEEAWIRGRDILLHQPLETLGRRNDPGPGALYVDSDEQTVLATVTENLEWVPHAVGVNNHMGSGFTENSEAMRRLLTAVRDEGLFFVDSVTSPRSVAYDEAQAMGMVSARRHVFLDHVRDEAQVCRQLGQLVKVAKEKGWAVGIGHPNAPTISALTRCADALLADVLVVGISELVQ